MSTIPAAPSDPAEPPPMLEAGDAELDAEEAAKLQKVCRALLDGLVGSGYEAVLVLNSAGAADAVLLSERENYSHAPLKAVQTTICVFTELGKMTPVQERASMLTAYTVLKRRSQQLRGPNGEGYCGTCQDFSVIEKTGTQRWLTSGDAIEVRSPPSPGKPLDLVLPKGPGRVIRWLIPGARLVWTCARCGQAEADPELVQQLVGIPPKIAYQMIVAGQWRVERETPATEDKAS